VLADRGIRASVSSCAAQTWELLMKNHAQS
jgi:hypothetical protein